MVIEVVYKLKDNANVIFSHSLIGNMAKQLPDTKLPVYPASNLHRQMFVAQGWVGEKIKKISTIQKETKKKITLHFILLDGLVLPNTLVVVFRGQSNVRAGPYHTPAA